MYHESYEDYIRSILGYPNDRNNHYENNFNQEMDTEQTNNEELEECYPEIYKVVYPMVRKACSINTKPCDKALIDQLTNEIYESIETDHPINVNIHLTNQISTSNMNRTSSVSTNRTEPSRESRRENRQIRNKGLEDLIRILLIRELLGRPGRFPNNRPPFPPSRPPMRTPFPGGPGGRPPMMPRDGYYQNMNDIYEER